MGAKASQITDFRRAGGAAAAVTVVGGTLVLGGSPANALTIVVDSVADDGAGSLRAAVAQANASPGPDTITFDPSLGATITLTTGRIGISDDLTIAGPGQSSLTLTTTTGDILYLYNGASLELSNITVSGGMDDNIAASADAGDVRISSVTLSGASDAAVRVTNPAADLTLESSTITAIGDHGVAVVAADDVSVTSSVLSENLDAGLYVRAASTVTISDSTLSDNIDDGAYLTVVSGDVTVIGSTLDGNTGLGLKLEDGGGSLEIDDTSMSDNAGYAVYIRSISGDVTVSDSHLDRNGDNGFRIDDFLGGSLAVVDSTIDDNAAAGMYLDDGPGNADAEITVTRTSITGNGGTGLYLKDLGADVTIADSTMNNNANNGMYVTKSSGSVTITGSTMSDNTDNGLYLNRIAGDATITDSTMNGNGSQGIELSDVVGTSTVRDVNVDGGEEEGLVISRSGAALVERVHADGNALEAIRVTDSVGSTTITDSTLSGSTSEFGFATRDNVGDVRLERVTISGNAHGGLELLADTGQVVLVNSTITDNGVLVTDPVVSSTSEHLEIVHSTMAGNGVTASTAAAIEVTDTVVTVDHSIVSGNNGMDVSSVSGTGSVSVTNSVVPDGSSLGASNPEADDPLLGPLADNGGTTGTMLPLEESPAIDAGSPALTAPPAPLTDQRGEDRVVDVIDIGAVEVQSADAVNSLSPARFVDTRSTGDTFDDRYEGEGKRAADSEYVVEIAGRGGVPADAKAVVINVTAVAVDARGFVTVHPCVSPRPLASSLNYTEGVNLANEIVAPLNADGELCLYTLRAAHLLVDVVGYVDADAPTVPVTPARYLDTRANGVTFDAEAQRGGRTTAGGSVTLQVGDRGQVPAGVAAVIANVTAVGPTERGYVTAHPCAPSVPNASSLNFVAGVNRANELIAPVNADGELCLFTSSPVDLVVDVVGYIPQGSSFDPLVPRRFLDTRSTGETVDGLAQGAGRRPADSQVELQVAGRPGVPAAATAVVINVTAAAPQTRGFVTVHPCVDPRPNASSLNYVAGVNGANELIARLDADGKLCLYTNQSIDLIVDVVGWLG